MFAESLGKALRGLTWGLHLPTQLTFRPSSSKAKGSSLNQSCASHVPSRVIIKQKLKLLVF